MLINVIYFYVMYVDWWKWKHVIALHCLTISFLLECVYSCFTGCRFIGPLLPSASFLHIMNRYTFELYGRTSFTKIKKKKRKGRETCTKRKHTHGKNRRNRWLNESIPYFLYTKFDCKTMLDVVRERASKTRRDRARLLLLLSFFGMNSQNTK